MGVVMMYFYLLWFGHAPEDRKKQYRDLIAKHITNPEDLP